MAKIKQSNLDTSVITGHTELNQTAAADDVFLVYDTNADRLKKIQKSNIISLSYSSGTATGDGSTTTFTINSGRSVSDIFVDVNGILLTPTTDYTISGTDLTFQTAPSNGAEITIRYLPI
jgi:hypothetical protein